jgi:two-component system sensor histidine kinase/response regulator
VIAELSSYTQYKLLLVEDNEINREVMLDILSSVGLQADVAENGQVAVSMVLENHYDLILMDMQMPVMGGVEATRAIRHIVGYQRTPILALTASAFEADRQSCLNAGMNDHLVKPVLPDILYAALLQWLPVPGCLAAAEVAASTISQEIALPEVPKIDLPVLAGLDVNVGLAYVRGRPAFYRRCLELLVRDHRNDPATIREDVCFGRFADARRRAHSLKGASAMLGAEAIRSTAARIELLLSEQDFPEPSSDALEVELITLAQALADLSLALVTTAQSGHQTDSLFAIKK